MSWYGLQLYHCLGIVDRFLNQSGTYNHWAQLGHLTKMRSHHRTKQIKKDKGKSIISRSWLVSFECPSTTPHSAYFLLFLFFFCFLSFASGSIGVACTRRCRTSLGLRVASRHIMPKGSKDFQDTFADQGAARICCKRSNVQAFYTIMPPVSSWSYTVAVKGKQCNVAATGLFTVYEDEQYLGHGNWTGKIHGGMDSSRCDVWW